MKGLRRDVFVVSGESSRTCGAAAKSYLLVDSFEGALSDFADETVVDAYSTEEDAICEVLERVSALAKFHRGEFPTDDVLDAFLQRDIRTELTRNKWIRYVSDDGCRFSWHILPTPEIQVKEEANACR